MPAADRFLSWLAHVLPWYDERRHDWTEQVVAASRARRQAAEATIAAAYREADAQRRRR